jgi:hypothetical protein
VFSNNVTQTVRYPNTLWSDIPVLMNSDTSLYLHTDLPRRNHGAIDNLEHADFRESSILCCIPNLTPPFQNMFINPENQFVYYLSVNKIDSFRLWVTDEYNNPVDLKYDWTLALKVEYIEIDAMDEQTKCLMEIKDAIKFMALAPMFHR